VIEIYSKITVIAFVSRNV